MPASWVTFESGYSSAVFGVDLVGGGRVVVKARPWNARLVATSDVQRRLFARGFRCPRLLRGPIITDGLAVSLEEFVEGEDRLHGDEAAAPLARVLAELIDRAPAPAEVGPLPPPYGFLQWPRTRLARLWPATPEVRIDLNQQEFAVPWIDDLAPRVAARLEKSGPDVVGHGDWWSDNVRWHNGSLAAVDDWDSVVALPEAALVGIAAAIFNDGESTIEQTQRFLDAYTTVVARLDDGASQEIAWAAGLWARLVDAKKGRALGRGANADRLRTEAPERARRAGIVPDRS